MNVVRRVPNASGRSRTDRLRRDPDVPDGVPDGIDASRRAGVSSPRILSFDMVSVAWIRKPTRTRWHQQRGPLVSEWDPSATDGSAKSFRYYPAKTTEHLELPTKSFSIKNELVLYSSLSDTG